MSEPDKPMSQELPWSIGPVRPRLEVGEVHVWLARLDGGRWDVESLRGTLDEQERRRAERFRRAEDRLRYERAHGVLRMLLGRYVGVEAGGVVLVNSGKGKPMVRNGGGGERVQFSLSRSGAYAAVAVGLDRPVGVDVEEMREVDVAGVAGQLAAGEKGWLEGLPAERRREGFYALWTCKEACLKASGEGLSFPLNQFEVTPAGEMEAVGVRLGEREWRVMRLPAPGGYAMAVAVGRSNPTLRLWLVG